MKSRTAILILAAGSASRMGRPKQLLPFGESHLLDNAINHAVEAGFGPIFCVLGANYNAIAKTLDTQLLTLVFNEKWKEGLGSSIAKGVDFIQQKDLNTEAILIILADQPLVDVSYLNSIHSLSKKHPDTIIASDYGDFSGVPALFPKSYFEELKALKGDSGAKKLLNGNIKNLMLVEANNKLKDIDTPQEYQAILKEGKS